MTATGWAVRGLGRLSNVPLDRQLADLATRSYPAYAPPPRGMRARYDVRETTVEGCPVLRLTPHEGANGQHLIYTHGGWYVRPLVAEHWWFLDRSTRGTGVTITLPFYRLAPEGDVQHAYELLRTVYAGLTASGSGAHRLGRRRAGARSGHRVSSCRGTTSAAGRPVLALGGHRHGQPRDRDSAAPRSDVARR